MICFPAVVRLHVPTKLRDDIMYYRMIKGFYWVLIGTMLIMLPDFIRTQHWMYYITAGITVYGIIICKVLERLTKPSEPMDEISFKSLSNDKKLKKQVYRMALHFALRATIVIMTVMVADIALTEIYITRDLEVRMGELVGGVELLLEEGPFMMVTLAVFVTVELIRLKRKKASAKTKTEAETDT